MGEAGAQFYDAFVMGAMEVQPSDCAGKFPDASVGKASMLEPGGQSCQAEEPAAFF